MIILIAALQDVGRSSINDVWFILRLLSAKLSSITLYILH